MKRQILIFGMLMITGATALVLSQKAHNSSAGHGAPQIEKSAYRLSGPYTHKNLTIFLIHNRNQTNTVAPLTLQEALAQKKVVVHETSSVNELTIENVSDKDVFVQSGDIVKGGKQDRVLALDLIVPPRSGKVAISAFCVESGRWQQRGTESSAVFNSSDQMLNHKDLKIAAKAKRSQQEVWDKVAESQHKLSANVGVVARAGGGSGGGSGSGGGRGAGDGDSGTGRNSAGGMLGGSARGIPQTQQVVEVRAAASASSLQLTLENKQVQETAESYVSKLSSIVDGYGDVVGYAFAINGTVNSADVYSSRAMFIKLWPKLLKSNAIEAISEFDKSRPRQLIRAAEVTAFLNEAEAGTVEQRKLTPRVTMLKAESRQGILFETRDLESKTRWLHRSYLRK